MHFSYWFKETKSHNLKLTLLPGKNNWRKGSCSEQTVPEKQGKIVDNLPALCCFNYETLDAKR